MRLGELAGWPATPRRGGSPRRARGDGQPRPGAHACSAGREVAANRYPIHVVAPMRRSPCRSWAVPWATPCAGIGAASVGMAHVVAEGALGAQVARGAGPAGGRRHGGDAGPGARGGRAAIRSRWRWSRWRRPGGPRCSASPRPRRAPLAAPARRARRRGLDRLGHHRRRRHRRAGLPRRAGRHRLQAGAGRSPPPWSASHTVGPGRLLLCQYRLTGRRPRRATPPPGRSWPTWCAGPPTRGRPWAWRPR